MGKCGNRADNLLDSVGHKRLLVGVPTSEAKAAIRLLEPVLEECWWESTRYLAGVSYLIGIRQGVHQERQRRHRQ